jgi:CBS domain-containing protein
MNRGRQILLRGPRPRRGHAEYGDIQVRRLPVLNRDKRLVGILSLGDVAGSDDAKGAGNALRGVSRPGGEHNQTG